MAPKASTTPSTQLTTYQPVRLVDQLRARAAREERSLSYIVRRALERELERCEAA